MSVAAAATERCRVWPKTAAQDVKCVRAGALSWCRICPSGAYSWCTIPSESKNASNMTFVLFRTWRPFFGRGDVWRNQSNTCVRPTGSSPYVCCNNWYVSVAVFPISKQNLRQMRCSVLSHIVQIPVTQTPVLLPRPTAANWANAATCNLCHELLRHVWTCQDWLQTHPTRWTATTVPIRILFEQTSYIGLHVKLFYSYRVLNQFQFSWQDFWETFIHQILWKSVQRADCSVRTDRHDETNSRFP